MMVVMMIVMMVVMIGDACYCLFIFSDFCTHVVHIRAFNVARARAAEFCSVLKSMRGAGIKQLDGEEVGSHVMLHKSHVMELHTTCCTSHVTRRRAARM